MTLRFLHTSDWQLGMTRAFLPPESQARYGDDQIAAVRRMAQIAEQKSCAFVVVAGDVFESIQPDRRVVSRALDALAAFTVPVYLLPGNHDHDGPAALWSTTDVLARLPARVRLLRDAVPVRVPGVAAEIVGAPLPSLRPDRDLLCAALEALEPPAPGVARVAVGHGRVDAIDPDRANPSLMALAAIEAAVADGRVSYVALGDRHSMTRLAEAVWYSGAPLATAYREEGPNKALVVDVDAGAAGGNGVGGDSGAPRVSVEPVEVGTWRFVAENLEVSDSRSVAAVEAFLADQPGKERTVVKLGLVGTVSLTTRAALEDVLDRSRDLFAALELSERRSELVVVTDDADLARLDLSGFAREALDELAALAAMAPAGPPAGPPAERPAGPPAERPAGPDNERPDAGTEEEARAQSARDALMLLHRLAARVRARPPTATERGIP